MFRSFIYLDEDKLYSYKSIVDGGAVHVPQGYTKTKKAAGSIGHGPVSGTGEKESQETGAIKSNVEYDYDQFERSLSKVEPESFFDFVLNGENYEIESLPSMCLIKIQATMEIPEKFDMLNVIEQFKPILLKSMSVSSDGEAAAMNLLNNTNADIPVIIDTGETLITAKLGIKSLLEEYTDLEAYQNEEITFLCKVVGLVRGTTVEIYNPARDFIKMNRALRRGAKLDENEALKPIRVEGPILKAEVVAVYK